MYRDKKIFQAAPVHVHCLRLEKPLLIMHFNFLRVSSFISFYKITTKRSFSSLLDTYHLMQNHIREYFQTTFDISTRSNHTLKLLSLSLASKMASTFVFVRRIKFVLRSALSK